ncbi:PREDICTED: zinc finger protein-like [Papilio polytes]|uniref:zinc finger protein-like n=1 Tax=Papilio polytes TaxID=76194 RepID=UPI0006761D9F|nr:PREDICTED: zinc finger protein-like [Papilio polytes]
MKMDEKSETYYHCILCAQLECTSKLISLQSDDEVFHKTIVKLSRLNILYDYDETLPKNICESCNDNLEKAFAFVVKVDKARNILSDIYKNKNNYLKEQDSDISDNDCLKGEYCDYLKNQQSCVLENVKVEFSDYQPNHVLDQGVILEQQQNNDLEEQQNNIVEQQNDIVEQQQNVIVEYQHSEVSSGNKSDCNAGLDFEIYSQSSNDSSDISEAESSSECVRNNKIKKSSGSTDLILTWNDYLWTCSICETQFSNNEELKLHSMQYHQICNPLKCHECNIRKLYLNAFIVHVQRHNTHLKFMCYKCNCKFTCTRALNSHTRSAHGPKTKYVCPGCNVDFESSEELKVHMDTFYRGKRFIHVPVELVSNQNSLTCDICQKSFNNKRLLHSHLFIHTDRKKEHICDICGKGFVSKNQLKCHTMSHKDNRSHECNICKSSFKTLTHLKKHKAIHSNEKPHKCDQCGKGFRLKSYLKSHLIIHTNSLPFDCIYCDKKFRFKSIRDQHIRQHTGLKPYSCEICSRDFTNWSNYNKHMKRRHDLNMAKRKTTPEGVYPINPSTGKIIKYDVNETLESKNQNIKGRVKRMTSFHKNPQINDLDGAQNDKSETK